MIQLGILAYVFLPMAWALLRAWRDSRIAQLDPERAVRTLRAAGFTNVSWRVARVDLAPGQLVTTADLEPLPRATEKLPLCVAGHHSFSWRHGIEPCRYCGEPLPAVENAEEA